MITAIVQARRASSRLPDKVLKNLAEDKSCLEIIIERLKRSECLDQIVIATTTCELDNKIVDLADKLGVLSSRGSVDDVLRRYYDAASEYGSTVIARITADCPLIDAELLDSMLRFFDKEQYKYISNREPETFPDGIDIEIFDFAALEKATKEATDAFSREHVTPYMVKNVPSYNYRNSIDESHYRLTLDEEADFQLLSSVFDFFSPNIYFSWRDAVRVINENDLGDINKHLIRNEGANMATGQKVWRRAQSVIPGGSMLFSKNPDLHLPRRWPAYYSKAKGYTIWDLDGESYDDFYLMGVGTNILGYAHDKIDEAVISGIRSGNLTSLNCHEEVVLAEKLLSLHSWASGVRFARSGGEANTIAIRLARAATGREAVAVCGYHGWHDWYLSANLTDKDTLGNHLMEGLSVTGIPKSLKGLTHAFRYNDIDGLERLIETEKIGAVKMEVMRNVAPENDFLNKVRQLCSKKGIVLIFDECSSGFRELLGGLHKKFSVTPDVVVYGKTIGNGYALTAVVGVDEVMKGAKQSFISSTFWTERIGSIAGLATIKEMEQNPPWDKISDVSRQIRNIWDRYSEQFSLNIRQFGTTAIPSFTFESEFAQQYRQYLTQELLKVNILGGSSVYVSACHDQNLIDRYEESISQIFRKISAFEADKDVHKYTETPQALTSFARMN